MSCSIDLIPYCAAVDAGDCTGNTVPTFLCQLDDGVCIPAVESTDLTRIECLQSGSSWSEVGTSADALTAAGEQIVGYFWNGLPAILAVVVAVIITLWGIRWIVHKFGVISGMK